MKRIAVVVLILLLVGAAAAYFGGFLDPLLGEASDPAAVSGSMNADNPPVATASDGVQGDGASFPLEADRLIADARVVPVRQAALSLPVGGIVVDVAAAEGEQVEAGDLILRLDDARQRTAVEQAQAQVMAAQARLAELQAGPRSEEIAASEAARDVAEAALARLQAGTGPGDVAAAEAALSGAQAALRQVLEGAGDQELIAAQAEMANAEAELQRAQRAYNQVSWRNDVGALPESAALQTATNLYEAARARYQDLAEGPSAAQIARAQADVRQAEARLDTVEGALPGDVAAAEAEVRRAQAQLDLLTAGARTEAIQAAEADVAAAVAVLQDTLVALRDTELRAPFAGTVAALDVELGEQVTAADPVARLAQLGDWEIRTEDLTEFQVVGIEPGQSVTISFDAIPDLLLTGIVERIRPIGTNQRGDIVYTVVVHPDENDDRILWNMTAVTEFEASN